MIRCDQCDNRVIRGWSFCAYCGYPQTDSGIQTAQREMAARDRLESNLRHWREECGKLHSQQTSLKTAAITLRAFAGGDAVVPDNLRLVPFSAMDAIADWLWPIEDPDESEDEEPETLWECKP